MADAPEAGGKLAVFKHKYGPLPLWGWMAGILFAALGYALIKQRKSSATTTASGASGATASGEVPDDQVPDVIIQNDLAGPATSGSTTAPAPPGKSTPPAAGSIGAGGAPASPGIHEYTGNGKLTLAQVAKRHKTTPAQIIKATNANKNNISKQLKAYLAAGNFNKPIPKGDTIIYTNG